MTILAPPRPPGPHLDAGVLYLNHAKDVARFLKRLGAQELEDEVHEVFLRAHRLGGFTPGAAQPLTWLYHIAAYVRRERRRAKRRRPMELSDDAVGRAIAASPSPEDDTAAREGLKRLRRALDTLSDEEREMIVLFELEGQSCENIARAFQIKIGTVYAYLHAARAQLREYYQRCERGGFGSGSPPFGVEQGYESATARV